MYAVLLVHSGYFVGKYISIEKLIEESKETYYETLQQSSQQWHKANNDYEPFVRYLIGVILAAYREFSSRVDNLITKRLSKSERIQEVNKETLGKITKSDILGKCPDISQVTVQRTLDALQKSGAIIKIGGGRYTTYTWNKDKE